MNNKSPWYKWPENKRTGRNPLYIMVWRLIWMIPLLIGLFYTYIIIVISRGFSTANEWVKKAT